MRLPAVKNATARGQSLVEFALILPILILMLVGVLDFGRAIYAYNTINNAAREGARLAIVDQTELDIQERAAGAGVSLGVDPADVIVDFRDSASAAAGSCDDKIGQPTIVGCLAVVTVPYQYTAATPVIGSLVGVLMLAGESQFAVEFNCVDGGTVTVDCPLGD